MKFNTTIASKLILCIIIALLIAACIPIKISVSPDGTLVLRGKNKVIVAKQDGSGWKEFLEKKNGEIYWTEWSPNGNAIVVSGQKNGSEYYLSVLEPSTGKERLLLEDSEMLWLPQWSPDGKSISFLMEEKKDESDNFSLRVVDLVTGSNRIVAHRTSLGHAWSPDGKQIATALSEKAVDAESFGLGVLGLVDVSSKEMTYLAGVLYWPYMQFQFSPDGKILYFSSPSTKFPVLVDNKKKEKKTPMPMVKSAVFAFYLDSKKLAPITPETQDAIYFVLSPNGKHILYVSAGPDRDDYSPLKGDLYIADADGGDRKKIGSNHENCFPLWSDSSSVLFGDAHEEGGEFTLCAMDITMGKKKPLPAVFQNLFYPEK